ncbi:HMG high mobility group box-containing protein [Nitzschia inconspicua]|uniref:HMG high mobility group box-containing protein n=1 Tax=Nitzschia inconspicua TaxID=303405 RepID=A0A9K3LQH1_9STRA|nr:HMG high mobility group box-containing protein [Nitzschia inconspicua]
MSGFPMNFGGMGGGGESMDGSFGPAGGMGVGGEFPGNEDVGGVGNPMMNNMNNMNNMMFMGNQMGASSMYPFQQMQGGGGMDPLSMSMSGGIPSAVGMNSQFVPELDMMALYRAKQNMSMMNRGRGGSAQEKMMAFTQEQFSKGQGRPLSGGMLPPFMGGVEVGMKRSAAEADMDTSYSSKKGKDSVKGKKRKKSKKKTDMPRRALSAYNIFFSEQREVILKEIDAREKDKGDGGGHNEEGDEKPTAEEDEKPEDDTPEKKEDQQEGVEKEGERHETEGDSKVPKVLNRTFFPKRAKRAHRKVHGKIGLVDLAREVSKRWKELDSEGKKRYENLAEADRKKHKEIMAEYQERKAAENMVSMGASDSADEDEGEDSSSLDKFKDKVPSDQDVRDSVAHQYQQRVLAEMMAARRPQQDPMARMNMNNNFMMGSRGMGTSMGMGGGMSMGGGMGMSEMQAMQNMNNMQEMNTMLEFQNQQRALMLQRMRMGGMGGMGMDGMGMGGMGPPM